MKALERDKKQESESYLMAAILLGSAYEHKGDTQSAYEYYSRGLSADPKNDALLILRGMLMYGINPEAIADLELAVKLGSQTVWPYFFLRTTTWVGIGSTTVAGFASVRSICLLPTPCTANCWTGSR